jgi:NAD(P)-dependent dehydrogenase (short-subunit alcohol dehydrogenase family)
MTARSGECTFNLCWGGVYFTTSAFLPLLRATGEAHLVDASSINGFWASVGSDMPHTANSAAKFAVKGFTEALIADFRINAPHIKVSSVMRGHYRDRHPRYSLCHPSGFVSWALRCDPS